MSESDAVAWWCGCPFFEPKSGWWGVPRKSSHYNYAWEKLSKQVRAEEPFCYACGAPSTSADHIIPVLEAPHLRLVRSNLRGSCSKHNQGRVSGRQRRKTQILNSPAVVREW